MIVPSLAYPDLFHEQTDSGAKRFKTNKSNDNNGNLRTEAETDSRSAGKAVSKNSPAPEPPKQDYIHVRARRGQATDSHSLAERVMIATFSIFTIPIFTNLAPVCKNALYEFKPFATM